MQARHFAVLVVGGCLALAEPVHAQAPLGSGFTYQGELTDAGVPLDGPAQADIRATVWDALVGGVQIGSPSTAYDVDFENGRFTIEFDFGASPFDGDARYLQLAVRAPAGSGGFTTLSPRQPLTAAPYALYALDGAGGGSSLWSESGSDIYYNAGNVGIGTDSPSESLVVGTDFGVDFSGNRLAIGEATAGTTPGIVVGEDAYNRGWLTWSVDSDVFSLGTRVGGAWYGDTLALRSGRVGVGTADPTAPLEVWSALPKPSIVTANGNDYATWAGQYMSFGHWDGSDYVVRLGIEDDGTTLMVPNGGNVGIGTDSPSGYGRLLVKQETDVQGGGLAVQGSATRSLRLWIDPDNTTAHIDCADAGNGPIVLNRGGGFVGIGTSQPDEKLTIAGAGETFIRVDRGLDQHGGTWWHEDGSSQWIFPYFRGWQSDNLIVRDETASRDVMVFEAGSGNVILPGQSSSDSIVLSGTEGTSNGQIEMFNSLGNRTVQIDAETATDQSGYMGVYDGNGVERIELDGDEDGFPAVRLYREDGDTPSIELLASEGADGGQIAIYNSSGEDRIILDAEHGGVGARSRIIVDVLEITGGSDLAEPFAIASHQENAEHVRAGMVVVIDPDQAGQLKVATEAYDCKVAGVISGANGLQPGMIMKAEGAKHADGDHPVALTGRVWCWFDASYGAIEPGDLLTTSATPGHAMRVGDYANAQGAIVGKAMTPLADETGLVLVLVSLQ
jgi:hypothetical protein